jgi:hypothetical protein
MKFYSRIFYIFQIRQLLSHPSRSRFISLELSTNRANIPSTVMKRFSTLVSFITLASSLLGVDSFATSFLRRGFIFNSGEVIGGSATATALRMAAMEDCPPNSKNCIRTTWTPPSGTNKAGMAKSVKAVLNAYPQEGRYFFCMPCL